MANYQNKIAKTIIRIGIVLFLLLLMTSCLPFIHWGRNRVYFPHSVDNLYQFSRDFQNPVFQKYTVGDTVFMLLADMYSFTARSEDIKKDIASTGFGIRIYSKHEGNVTYRLIKSIVRTSSFSDDILNLQYGNTAEDNKHSAALVTMTSRTDGYRFATLRNGYFKFPRPKDMKFSITVEIEETTESNTAVYEFTYDFIFTKKDSLFTLLL